ncbi:MAG TPA: hypothetical protein VJ742_09200, partial [Nitrososphaera sp.]|nr:hypothetical protein [Nitrososphaera sp.]
TDRIEILDATTLNKLSEIVGKAVRPKGSQTDLNNNYYISFDNLGIHVWDIIKGAKVHSWNKQVDSFGPLGEERDKFLALVEDEKSKTTALSLFDTSKFQETKLLTLNFRVDIWRSNSEIIAFAGKDFLPNNTGAQEGIIEVYDRRTLTLKSKIKVPFVTGYLQYGTVNNSGFSGFAVDPKGTEAILSTYWQDGFGHSATYSQEARLYNLASGEKTRSIKPGVDVREVSYKKDSPDQLNVTYAGGTYTYDGQSDNYVGWNNLRADEHQRFMRSKKVEIRYGENYVRFADLATGENKQLLFNDDLVSIEIFEDKNLMVVLSTSNEISFYDLARLEKRLSIISKKDNEWIAYATTGEFVSSINGADKVYWSLGDTYLEFEALKSEFERPGIIAS